MIKADTKADTKRHAPDAFLDFVAIEIITNSSRVGWSGCPLTPVTRVRTPLGLPIKKKSHNIVALFYLKGVPDPQVSSTITDIVKGKFFKQGYNLPCFIYKRPCTGVTN